MSLGDHINLLFTYLLITRSSTPGSIMATSCLSDFLSISNDVYSPYSTPQLVW